MAIPLFKALEIYKASAVERGIGKSFVISIFFYFTGQPKKALFIWVLFALAKIRKSRQRTQA